MTLDNLQEEDIERIFNQQATLKEINEELGNKVLDVWIETGIKQAHSQHIMPYEIPEYLDLYIKERYRAYYKPQ